MRLRGKVVPDQQTCDHEFGALGAASESSCIHCGLKLKDNPGISGEMLPCVRCGIAVLITPGTPAHLVACAKHCPFDDRDDCWDAQEERGDPYATCVVHGQSRDTLDRLGVDVL
jgi:hypothetical protein